jgi:2-polyprenyl-6-methoxyphenol hydroxylase-like FAD-dependent oxidoreductase
MDEDKEPGPTRTGVLVVGAGPTGLLLASELVRRGVACELIDAQPGPLPWDRATVFHARSLEIFESLGLAAEILDRGTPQRGARVLSGGELLGGFDLSECGSRYEFSVGISEEVTESVLTKFLEGQGGEVHRSTRLVGLTAGPDRVVAEIERDGAHHQLEADWIVGCDGLHSVTRDAVGIRLEGHDIAEPWAVFDATVRDWPEVYDLTFVYLEEPPLILTALPGRRWRAYLRPTSPESDLVADATATIRRYYPEVAFVDVEHPTRFHCHSMVADRFRTGRVLLAGDAAHLCSPAQGHGMNTGLHDAENLAWKLALVHQGVADPALLDSYDVERRPVAQRVADEGDEFDRAQLLTDRAERRARDVGLRGTFADRDASHHEAVAEAELDADYRDSPVVAAPDTGTAGELVAGRRLPDTVPAAAPDGATAWLHEPTLRTGHTVLLLAGPDADRSAVSKLLAAVEAAITGSPVFGAVVAFAAGSDRAGGVGTIDAPIAARLGVKGATVVAVRPDGYIGLRADHDHLERLARYEDGIRRGRS